MMRDRIDSLHEEVQRCQPSLYFLASISCFVLIFISLPIALASFEDNVDGLLGYVSFFSISNAIIFLVYLGAVAGIYLASSGRIRTILTFATVLLLLLSVFYGLIYQKDYGVLDNFRFSNKDALIPTLEIAAVDIVMCAALFFLSYWLLLKKCSLLANLLVIFIVSNLAYAGVGIYKIHEKTTKETPVTANNSIKLFNYSKTGRNVVLLFIDGAMDGFIPDMLREEPYLSNAYQGFTWYSNVVSTGNRTINGLPSVFGGFDYTVSAINKRKGILLKDKVSQAYSLYPDNFTQKGYDVLYSDPFWFGFERKGDCELFNKTNKGRSIHSIGKYLPEERYHLTVKKQFFKGLLKQYAALSVFKIVPASFRNAVYGDGKWMNCSYAWKKKEDKYLDNYYSLAALGQLSDTNSSKNTFTFIANELPRAPLLLGKNHLPDRRMVASQDSLDRFKTEDSVAIYQTTKCTIQMVAKYLDWFKQNNIYDNTMFVVVSDHGWTSHNPVLNNNKNQIVYSMFQSFLMVKPYNSSGMLKESKEFISNASVPGIICDTIGGCIDRYTGNKVTYKKIDQPLVLHETPWQPSNQAPDAFIVDKMHEVKEDITKPENWKTFDQRIPQ